MLPSDHKPWKESRFQAYGCNFAILRLERNIMKSFHNVISCGSHRLGLKGDVSWTQPPFCNFSRFPCRGNVVLQMKDHPSNTLMCEALFFVIFFEKAETPTLVYEGIMLLYQCIRELLDMQFSSNLVFTRLFYVFPEGSDDVTFFGIWLIIT